jgi:hypothetical protein
MFEPKTASEKLMFSTVRVVGQTAKGETKTGTGFFYGFPGEGDNRHRILVTNKHVVDGMLFSEVLVHGFVKQAEFPKKPTHKFSIRVPANMWVFHPNPKVDLCAAPFGDPGNPENLIPFVADLSPEIIPTAEVLEDLNAVEDVLMLGYPNGLWDAVNNFPLARRGITASHPALDFDVNGVATTALDIAAFPGSSGSPVFVYNEGSIPNKAGGLKLGSRLLFIGILFSGPTLRSDGQIVIRNIPTSTVPVAQFNQMMNLGYAIKTKELAALANAVVAKFKA